MRSHSRLHRSIVGVPSLAALGWLALSLAASSGANAQIGDRKLLSTGGGDPYVMILFDTSGSMNWGTQCTASDRATGYCQGGSESGEDCVIGDASDACVLNGGECVGLCSHDCPEPNCPRPMNGDDPDSKVYQAKDALYTVMKDVTGVRWGFASLNQENLAVGAKHWLYEVTAVSGGGPDLPPVGWQEVFGPQTGGSGNTQFDMTCDRNGAGNANNAALYETGCYATSQDAPYYASTDADDFWELEKVRRLPKGGEFGTQSVTYYVRAGSGGSASYYKVTYSGLNGGAGAVYATTDSFTLTATIESCASNGVAADGLTCSAGWASVATRTITYSRLDSFGARDPHLGEFLWWEGTTSTDADYSKDAYFGGRTDGEPTLPGVGHYASGVYADKTCRGWEPSGDEWGQTDSSFTDVDPYPDINSDYNLRWRTTHSTFPALPASFSGFEFIFDFGDVIPLTWDEGDPLDDANLAAVLTRLNPKHPTIDDDSFTQSPYFADSYGSGESFLRLEVDDDPSTSGEDLDEAVRPLVAHGSTPLAGWFSMFRNWYSGCGDPGNCDGTGWSDVAALYDPNFACTKKYVLMITDGEETCDGSPQAGSEDYYEVNITEFPDGFSKTADQCRYRASLSAQEDVESLVIGFGTENKAKLQCANTPVFFADNKGELVELLVTLIGEIQEQAASFASAAVPTVQANILDKVYLSSFIPLNDEAVWPGRVDSFLKPLPLDDNNLPDRSASAKCGSSPARMTANCFAWDAGDAQLGWDDDLANYNPERLLLQAPLESQISDYMTGSFLDSSLQLGDGEEQRRVYFGLPSTSDVPGRRQLLDFPADPDVTVTDDASTENVEPEELANYEYAWNFDPTGKTMDERRQAVADVIAFTLKEKQAIISNICTAGQIGNACTSAADCDTSAGSGDGVCSADTKIQYLMGDVFHSNPLVLNPPSDFAFFTKNLYFQGEGTLSNAPGSGLCGDSAADTALRGPQISYAWYANKNLCRRVQLFVGSSDGQLHAFDAGTFDGTSCQLDFATTAGDTTLGGDAKCIAGAPGTIGNDCTLDSECDTAPGAADGICRPSTVGIYNFGTGREIFSFIPESMMPLVNELQVLDATGGGLTTQWGPDGTPRVADVFVDPYVGPGESAECEDRVWRTVLLTNYRSGGPGIVALDVTQPDVFDELHNIPEGIDATLDYVPSCSTNLADTPTPGCDTFCRSQAGQEDADCAKLPYPALRWEFRDLDGGGAPNDDDANLLADFAESWSRPFIARLSVCNGACNLADEPEDRFVAIFGGGVAETPANDATDETGNWLYMVDVETGETIYKRGGSGAGTSSPIVGAVPTDITGVDDNTDGRVDTLYFGTTAGFVYKVDLGDGPFSLDGSGQIVETDGNDADADPDFGAFDPFQVFSTDGKPIYLEIGAVFVPKKRANALLFGTGDRTDLWNASGDEGRFYALVDTNWADANRDGVRDGGVLTEADYPSVDPDAGGTANYLYGLANTSFQPGWYFTLDADEKLITEPFSLSGITFFTVYDPLIVEDSDVCAFSGESKIFVVNTVTTEGYAIQAGATERTRYVTAPTFTTQPFVESSATKNPGAENATSSADSWTDELEDIYRELQKLFPAGSKFANYTLDIKTVRSDTGVIFIAPVPIAIGPHDWKEF